MSFLMTDNNTWKFSGFDKLVMIGFDENDNPNIIEEGFLEIDYLDGSYYDSDGNEKKLLVKFENNMISFETLPEDYDFWQGTENCHKQGCLGYVADLLNELKLYKDSEYNIEYKGENDYTESFLWHLNFAKENHSEAFKNNFPNE